MVQDFRPARGVVGVYVIVHAESGRAYIGSSVNIGARLNSHRSCLRRRAHKNPRLQRAWDEHGESAFVFTIVERVASPDQLIPREKAWLAEGRTWDQAVGYNMTGGANGAGHQRTAEQRARYSAATKGKPKSAAHRANIWATRQVTPEMREQMAANGRMLKGKPKSAETRRKMSDSQRGSLNHRSKLTETVVIEIMRRLANGEKGRILAAEFGVSQAGISNIKHGKIWTHLTNVGQ